MEKLIKRRVQKQPLEFVVTSEAYAQYVRELSPDNKIAPARNFLMRTVKPEFREALRELMELPSLDLRLAANLLEEFLPDFEFDLGE